MNALLTVTLIALMTVSWGASYKVGCIKHGVDLGRSTEEVVALCKP